MISTEIIVRRGERSVSDDGAVTWGKYIEKKGLISSSNELGEHYEKICGYDLNKILHRISEDEKQVKSLTTD